jgi:REP element-mobilizing transposase RayT
MARRPRLHVPGGLYHVTLRGNHRQPIFVLDTDRDRLDSIVADASSRDDVTVHAFCWMTNHIHLLVEVGEAPLGRFMQRVASRYARFLQRSQETTGHLFERRYHAVLVDTERYLLDLVRYIHLNPVRGGLASDPADYRWSSHRDYLGRAHRPWVRQRRVLGMLAADPASARLAYANFVTQGLETPVASPLDDRSGGDWRVLGDREFERRLPVTAPAMRPPMSLDELITQTCEPSGLSLERLRSAARSPQLCALRTEIARRAVYERIATRSDVARALGRSVSAISQALEKARRKR